MPKPPETLYLDRLATPVGEGLLVTDNEGYLRAFDWTTHEDRMHLLLRRQNPPIALREGRAPDAIRSGLETYFAGDLGALAKIRWRTGGTAFQRSVWAALCTIPVGETVSYGRLAERIGKPKAMRAVGLANGANPVGVVVPCHRVIGSNGSLTGYGGGMDRKQWLLTHEGASFLRVAA
ncbi:methylated-DNA--[protein]-cysteine S-methyltransferase [Phenylobacterium sp.]|uniref:methylated-DNA--[protein]-cysteine S-methyltransferase n=1 Tax=Phenylobacterium sp. TaxID=1871053 RepID=UPI00272EF5E3|nr:methylated-DNA--[protein]-cysteine S-methyltransferase [Phenylobacterium sp.]MDP1599859.1 methylated-DNA--[protein]-cysteine S-methyltransferase [Phenylobacterium sp.]MDP3594762.1 methylated-DNA--[protein]-cysteine S-methyltransferase [Phenylobacterium sp.]